jgi:flavin-dependent dehydrogenase
LEDSLRLCDGSNVAVVGSGPAGSLFAYFLLEIASRVGLTLNVDLYEPKPFAKPGPQGCNMCGGIISESLAQNLASEGINLPGTVVQRGVDSYVLHMDVGSVKIDTPLQEMRIGAVHRGGGPRDVTESRWLSFDDYLLNRAIDKGARLVPARVDAVCRIDGKPSLTRRGGEPAVYDLLVAAVGVNSSVLSAFEALDIGYQRPGVTKTLIREYRLGEEIISRTLGSSMHVFLLNIPRLEFAAIIPKGNYVTMCLLGHDVDNALIEKFVSAPEVKACMPDGWNAADRSCQCMPHMNIRGVRQPFADRFIFIGDCGVTRLYKDGIGAAYRTAKAAARTAVFEGISTQAFARHYMRCCRNIEVDNRFGRLAFVFTEVAQRAPLLRRALLRQALAEQRRRGVERRLSGVLWDMFSGSAPYTDIFKRMLHPALVAQMAWGIAASAWPISGQRLEAPRS